MGWIRLGLPKANPSKQLHSIASRVEVDNITTATTTCEKSAETKVHHNGYHDTTYRFAPATTKSVDLPFIPSSEVAKRNGEDGARLWIVVDNTVLDVTQYICSHPGGQQIVRGFGGQECSWQWWTFHNRKVWNEVASSLRVGRTEGMQNRHVKPKAMVGLRGLGYQEDWS